MQGVLISGQHMTATLHSHWNILLCLNLDFVLVKGNDNGWHHILSCAGIKHELTSLLGIIYMVLIRTGKNCPLHKYKENKSNNPSAWILAYMTIPTPSAAPKNLTSTINLYSCQYWTKIQQQFNNFSLTISPKCLSYMNIVPLCINTHLLHFHTTNY
jgi:hypothetical protein